MSAQRVFNLLRRFESRNLTYFEPNGSWPIVWSRARSNYVWDIEGKKYLDLTAGFGVAAAGHSNPSVVKAGQTQMTSLLHGLSDVHPHESRAALARLLSAVTYERWTKGAIDVRMQRLKKPHPPIVGKTILCNSGFEAVEAAMKTAFLATGKPKVIAFRGAYHGLGYGTLNVTERPHFRAAFSAQVKQFGKFVRFPTDVKSLESITLAVRKNLRADVGAVLVEPVQVRGGVNVPPSMFLPQLRKLCDEFGVLLILDEIYTGFGRTGRWFACEHSGTVPDLICVGKALTGGFPMSACIGRADVMDAAWPIATGDPIHTSTFLGNPVGCAMALAQIKQLKRLRLISNSAILGRYLLQALSEINVSGLRLSARGLGLLAGLEVRLPDGSPATVLAFEVVKRMLDRGFIALPDGEYANVIEFTPPLTINQRELAGAVRVLTETLQELK
jgi:4-aminobutyrate aminotransferase-like enzyme